jgi:NADPH-dependent 2,4-dienoyl-CoA reductase/sulfur reductase-like enzyme
MPQECLMVIGGNAAGMSAASQARRQRPQLEILAFEQSPHTSYSA